VEPGLHAALVEAVEVEAELATELRRIGERHAADHDVFHVCHTLAEQCEGHIGRVRAAVPDLPDGGHESPVHGLIAAARRLTATAAGRSEMTGPLLLRDLRHLFAVAADCHLAWTIAVQGAKATRATDLVPIATECCEDVNGQMRWIKTKLKLAAPQVVSSA
jgi:hypothetical protein